MNAIILLGAPGAGKGTVSETVKKYSDYIHVSTGDMLREAVKAERPVGLKAKAFMEKGELVPDEVILEIVKERLNQNSKANYMFDGFPRTNNQAVLLDQVMQGLGGAVSKVFLLDVPRAMLISRIAGRRVCRKCGAVYHVTNIPSKVAGVCDHCGGELYQRPDDNEATIANRLDVFEKQTAPLIEYYQRKNLLVRISTTGRVETENEVLRGLGVARA